MLHHPATVRAGVRSRELRLEFAQLLLLAILLTIGVHLAEAQSAPAPPQPKLDSAVAQWLERADQFSQRTTNDLARLHVPRWKIDGDQKLALQDDADSLTRNLSRAMPQLLAQLRATPESLAANFKLLRNLDALYDVLTTVAESASAYGPNDQADPLSEDLKQLDSLRRNFADRLDVLAAAGDAEISRLRAQIAKAAQPAPRAPATTKKIVVDDNAPASPSNKPRTRKPPAVQPPSTVAEHP